MPILCLLLSTSYPFLPFRFLHFVLLSSSRSFFSTFLYILPCLFLVFSIFPPVFTPLHLSFSSFFLSIFLRPFPHIFPIFLPFLFFVSTYICPVYASFLFFSFPHFLSSLLSSFFYIFLFNPFCFLSFILSTHCLFSPFPPSFTS